MPGTLYLCATPIGNLEDITYRAVRILKEVDLIAAEDTRHTKKLLNHLEITTPLTSYHEHNKAAKGPILIEKLKEGLNIALVSDAGTPGISDPGEDLVRLAHENNILVTPVPGASAVISGLIISGLSTRRFIFEGFLPTDNKGRNERLRKLSNEDRTIVLYEAPHRLLKTLEALYEALGNRKISIVRELTKQYEEVKISTIEESIKYYQEVSPKGEFVLVIEGLSNEAINEIEIKKWENISIDEHVRLYIDQGKTQKEALKQVAKDRGLSKREVYQIIHQIK
ncbi:MAG: rRNA (cytidine1402-2-O)-methyltransferase [Epulopiscium sp.]|jgi:16S rRNA (cytidine1402-2'-O)-methyltransferase|uniref:Ribosomal RNA small subunit methyltransferase I n=1 Tax=Defluviitalea raffinosedens TaxID=1450156 RepID=A0A7C8HD13_9FIRM|nr:16S rRNA (cytidine(1402)-2'-O)-methyltransferase [Defluviitalea raffinosedens]KAE9628761.1 16S rRNA (cytidine(1402)-2'-O)-methyltransferase [Defluviitalea raffinosedens]MBM7686835.1 16S rRNA (cytidine1402-2'-O)-methyltransferase [Defluviitalea raffinosedens]MBZ4667683.1 rsmI [Defluviitaleaceae bacterium]MDK2787973.1 rRNA (cytidine1402-2-O)-methyltransferase [Candidatus Epulonipiscium sp.]